MTGEPQSLTISFAKPNVELFPEPGRYFTAVGRGERSEGRRLRLNFRVLAVAFVGHHTEANDVFAVQRVVVVSVFFVVRIPYPIAAL
ncbi:MAG TPA: hypothetical protein DCG12_04490, partial [Planctomycetaceae bacterium]|nr:hypothetical protein [Planctomycetaceae bacterium]